MDYQILVEADFIVNIYEDNMMLQRDKSAYIDGICQNPYIYSDRWY